MGSYMGASSDIWGCLGDSPDVGFEGSVSCLFFLLFLRPSWVFSLPTAGSRYARL